MTIKLVIFKNGENIITDIKEGFYQEKLVCYILENPCLVAINGTYSIDGKNKHSISLNKWPILSKDNSLEIIPEWVVTIVEPVDELKELYENDVLGSIENETNQSNLFNEQSGSNQSD